MEKDLARLFAKRFIQRSDVKAIQFQKDAGNFHAGDWFPDSKIDPSKRPNSPHLPHGFKMQHLIAHLRGEETYGHYLLDAENQAKMFCFDIDLDKTGNWIKLPDWSTAPEDADDAWLADNVVVSEGVNPRNLWTDRSRSAAEARTWYKSQMKQLASLFTSAMRKCEIESAVAYSGSKGIHVYGFTGTLPAVEVREAAFLVMDFVDEFDPIRGKNFYKHRNDDPMTGFQNFTIEVFPKQDTLDGKSLGNLLRLPLGKNWKNPKDPTFFLNMNTPMSDFSPHANPVKLLETGDPYED